MAQIASFFSRPDFWVALLILIAGLAFLAWRLRLRWWPAWLLRAVLAGSVLLGLFAAHLDPQNRPVPQRQVMLVDQSDSLAPDARLQAWQKALAWQAGGENRSVVVFGANPAPALPGAHASKNIPVTGPDSIPAAPKVDGRASDLAGALQMGADLLAGSKGKILLATDGQSTQTTPAGVETVITALAKRGDTVDFLPLEPRPAAGDVALTGLSAPANLWAGTAFDLLAHVVGAAQLQLKINGQVAAIPAEPVGQDAYRFHIPSLPQGMAALQVTARPAAADGGVDPDPFPANNSAYVSLRVFPPPRVLFVTAEPAGDVFNRFARNLTQNGIQVDRLSPDKMPTNLGDLQNYRVIFLDNLLASQLSYEQMTALQVFVSRLAGGLVFLGGRNSYTLGGYKATPLEPLLPVKLEAPPRSVRPPIVFQLILDRSSSMADSRSAQPQTAIALAREAAMRSIETLKVQDYLGVLTFSDQSNWDVPLFPIGSPDGLKQALDAVSQVQAGGSTMMYQAMQDALAGMAALPADAPKSRHILLLSDGQSTDGNADGFQQLVENAHSQGITVSTIALGLSADTQLMNRIAEVGKGRFYAVQDANALPRILISESQAARSENIQTGDTGLKVSDTESPLLSGLSEKQLPTLKSYNALSSKRAQGAEDILVSASFGDPILSAWQYGLGRVVAWTADIGEEWTGAWPGGSDSAFWPQVVRYALVDPSLGPAQVAVQVDPTQLRVEASIDLPNGEPGTMSGVTFTYVGSGNETHTYPLSQASANGYHAEIARPPEGAYRAVLAYTGLDGQRVEVPAPFAVNPPAEWLPQDPSAGQTAMAAWAKAAGGKITPFAEATSPEPETKKPAAPAPVDGWWRLLLALVILWPLEIAIRRLKLPWK